MKTKLSLALAALLAGTAFGSMPKVLPEFKNEKQLAEWRAEMAAKAESDPSTLNVRSSTLDVPSAFYTGKPYVESIGTYTFKYRSYNPDLSRWTTEDPSGFPDGANGNVYAPRPTNGLDPCGLDTVTVTGTPDANQTGTPLGINVVTAATQVPNTIAAYMNTTWTIAGGTANGWIVQKVQFDVSKVYNDSDNSVYTLAHPPTSVYWEAWRVVDGNIQSSGNDSYTTPAFPESTHGQMTITGKAQYYSDSSFSAANGPYAWLTTAVPETGGLRATTTAPTWWTGSGLDHNLTMAWE
jgi:RHS repeat-associated protein